MKNDLEKLFEKIEIQNLNSLESRILAKIGRLELGQARRKVVFSWLGGGLSFAAIFPLLINLFGQLQVSGFGTYFSLLFTDTGAVLGYWREFLLALFESLPLFQLSLVLILTITLFVSLKFALKDYRRIGLSANLA